MTTVIVTGASGFIGKALVRRIEQQFGPDCKVLALGSSDVDLSDKDATFDWFERTHWRMDCDHIFHLAALYRAGAWPVDHPATQFFVNMSINVNLLEAWKRYFPKAKLTSILSYCIYPSHSDPHPESEAYGTEPEEYLFAYALTKKAQLIGQKAYFKEHGLTSTSVVLPTVYGPGDSFAEDSHVMGALVGKFVRAALENQDTVEVWGSGNQEREFLYVDDAADGIVAAALSDYPGHVNLGTGTAHSIRHIAETIAKHAGFQGRIVQNEGKFTGVHKRMLDVSLARSEIDWHAKTSLDDGIRQTIDWYRNRLGS